MEQYQDPWAAKQAEAQASLERAQKMQEYRQPQAPGMVGRVFVGTSPLQHMAEMLRIYQGGKAEKEATSALGNISAERNKAISEALRGFSTNMAGAPEQRTPMQADAFDEADRASLGGNQNLTSVTPERKADPYAAFAYLASAPDSALRSAGTTGMINMSTKQAEEQQAKAKQAQQAQLWQQSGGDAQAFLAAGGELDFAKNMVTGKTLGIPTVVRTVDTVDPRGRPVTQGYDANNNPVGPAIPKYVPPKTGPAAPAGYRYKRDGSLEAIPGGPADQKTKGGANITEGERKAGSLLTRLRGSQQQLADVTAKNPDAASPNFIGQALSSIGMESAGNLVTSGDRQRVNAAQLDLLDAALTLGTGAAYTKEQLEGYRKSYFPQIGDSPETIRDKEERLKNVIASAEVAAGRAEPQSVPQFGPGATRPGPTPQNLPQTGRIRFDAQGNIIK